MGWFERSRARRAERRQIRNGDYPGRKWVGVKYGHVVDQNGYHRCSRGLHHWDGIDLSCGLGPISGEYCEPAGYRSMFGVK